MPGNSDILLGLLQDGPGLLPGLAPSGPAGRMSPATMAFQTQMRMAQSLFSEPQTGLNASGMGLDQSLINDSLLMDALATITRLTDGGGRPATLDLGYGKPAGPALEPDFSSTGKVHVQTGGSAVIMGGLSAVFESGDKGVACIGYDRVGGTSYGKYQIASRPGTMDRFLKFLDEQAPEWADRLRQAGPANTGSKKGGMPQAWQAIAAEDPNGFEKLQHDFIRQEHYLPARDKILAATGLDLDKAPLAVREVLWSTAIQHGATGAADIFVRAYEGAGQAMAAKGADQAKDTDFNKLITDVYENRKHRFASSSSRVQKSVKARLSEEMRLALNMLEPNPVDRLV